MKDTVEKKLKPKHEVKTITPKMASEMLNMNLRNRPIRPGFVGAYKRDIENGDWIFDGTPIRFDSDGILLDGQHRLKACVETGQSIESLVVSNLDKRAQRVIDSGLRRNAGDYLCLEGVEGGKEVSAGCRVAMQMRDGRWTSANYTNTDIVNFYFENQEISDFLDVRKRDIIRMQSFTLAGCYIVSIVAPGRIDDFVDQWVDGQGPLNSPLIVFRNKIIRENMKRHGLKTQLKTNGFGAALAKWVKCETAVKASMPTKFDIPGWTQK